MKSLPGFTLFEILIVITVLGLVGGVGFMSYENSKANQDLNNSTEQLADQLRTAHLFSQTAKDERVWGVISTSTMAYALHSKNVVAIEKNEKAISLPNSVSIKNAFAVWFNQTSGTVDTDTIIILSTYRGITKNIHIAKSGIIDVIDHP
jgi:prepilin-type N-terminal cleavage/methylation domain-containing protein